MNELTNERLEQLEIYNSNMHEINTIHLIWKNTDLTLYIIYSLDAYIFAYIILFSIKIRKIITFYLYFKHSFKLFKLRLSR